MPSQAHSPLETVAVFGGSFDPPHAAHVLVAAYVLSVHPVGRLLVVPAFQHPLDKQLHAAFAERMQMCALAFSDLRRIELSDIEAELGGESRTLRLIEELGTRFPRARLRLVIGQDLTSEVHRWHRFEDIEKLAPPIVVGRAGHGSSTGIELPRVSSTDIRRRLVAGESTEGLLPSNVRAYIATHGLYGSSAESGR